MDMPNEQEQRQQPKPEKPTILPISEVVFINNKTLKETYSAEWHVKNKENVIRMLVGKINKLKEPYRIEVKVFDWNGD